MIDPIELRIGNILQSRDKDGDGSIITVKEFDLAGVNQFVSQAGYEHEYLYEKTYYYDWYWVEPISLTPEWLERCGEKCDKPDWQYQIQVGALKWYFRWNTEWYSELGGIYLGSRFQYVHQLQNLYFSLIGHELTIKSFNQSN